MRHQRIGQLLEMASFLRKNSVILPHPLLRRCTTRIPIIAEKVSNPDQLHKRCLCECITPVFRLCQLFGMTPGHFSHTFDLQEPTSALCLQDHVAINMYPRSHHPKLLESDKNYSCNLSVKYFSIPSVINFIFIIHFITVTIWVFRNMETVLKIYFNGTDLYTFALQVQFVYTQACGILINAFLKRRKLQRVWDLIQEVYKSHRIFTRTFAKTRNTQNLNRLKKFNYFLVTITCCTGALFATYFMHFVFRWCFYSVESAVEEMRSGSDSHAVGGKSDLQLLKVKPPCPFSNGFLFMQKICYTILTFYNMGFASLFFGFCAILWLLFNDIGLSLREVLNPKISSDNDSTWTKIHHPTKTNPLNKAEQLEHLRICHETLSKASRILGDCFGVSLLIVCVSALLSITCAIYTGALRMGIFNPTREETTFSTVSGFYVLSTVHGAVAVFVLMLILVSGQIVQNAASKPSEIIGKASHLHLNAEEKHQISVFLHKVGTSSTQIRACNVTTIGLSFLAAAATNVTTYILVILQFRLGVEPQVEADEQQQNLKMS